MKDLKQVQHNYQKVVDFENQLAEFFGAPYAVAVDCCTHGMELCLRMTKAKLLTIPRHTYLSVPFLSEKLNIDMKWSDEEWVNYYYLTERIIDAAVYWERDGYVPGTFMCLSFHWRKHLKLGKGGVILLDNKKEADTLRALACDGRDPSYQWRNQNIEQVGYRYFMPPLIAEKGLELLPEAIEREPKKWVHTDWPDISKMDVFQNNWKTVS